MALYTIFQNVKAVQTGPLSTPNQAVSPQSFGSANSPANAQTFTLLVNGIGTCSATAQIMGSNDGINFVTIGAPVTAAAATADLKAGIQGAVASSTYNYYGGYVTAISGTNAAATLTVSA